MYIEYWIARKPIIEGDEIIQNINSKIKTLIKFHVNKYIISVDRTHIYTYKYLFRYPTYGIDQ